MSVRTVGRIVYPRNAAEMLALAKTIYEKHLADGAASPLAIEGDYDWAIEGPRIAGCLQAHTEAEALRKKAEELYAARDLDLTAISAIVKNSGGILKKVYAKNPKKLGIYGLIVDDSPVKKVKEK